MFSESLKKEKKDVYYQILLGLIEEVKELENFLFPGTTMENPQSRYVRWSLIFTILWDHPFVKKMINSITKAGFAIDQFAKMMQKFYGDDSAIIHGVRLPDLSVEEMVRILAMYEKKPRYAEIQFMRILLESDNLMKNIMSPGKPLENMIT
jgi:hypothetical protein